LTVPACGWKYGRPHVTVPLMGIEMNVRKLLQEHRVVIQRLASEHGARNLRIFGSAARGTETAESDIDVLVSMEPGRSLLDLVALSMALEALLGRKVDVVSDGGLSPYLRDRILEEAVAL